jgi:Arc/MetJ-type ribon-helix-helix transcriptional regulator
MKKKSDRYRKFSASPEDEISDETCTTRLFEYDLAEVKSMCVDGKTKSDVIRDLVRRALYSRRYRQASTDPAFKEILRSFDDQMGVRLHHLEERLNRRMEADQVLIEAVLGYLYFAALFGVEEMKQVRFMLTDESATEEEFLTAWQERFRAIRERAGGNMRAQAEERRKRIEGPTGGNHSSE